VTLAWSSPVAGIDTHADPHPDPIPETNAGGDDRSAASHSVTDRTPDPALSHGPPPTQLDDRPLPEPPSQRLG
jgi:hypothetical protein